MNDAQLAEIREALGSLPHDRKMPGLFLQAVGFDFYSACYMAVFQWGEKNVTLKLTAERVAELREGDTFVFRRLRKELRAAFHQDLED